MKKIGRVIAFILIFAVLFAVAQSVLHYRWCDNEDIYSRNIAYQQEAENSIDVLVFGTSELYAGVFPTAMFHEAGITGINFATQNKSALTTYYQLEYALKTQKPKVVCCDFLALFDEHYSPTESETIYRKISDTMPDPVIKWKMVRDICRLDESQSELSYIFPMLRYHSMWNELSADNFKRDYVYNKNYRAYSKGCQIMDSEYEEDGLGSTILPEFWEREAAGAEMTEFAIEYYDRFVKLCHENDAKVVCLLPPKVVDGHLFAACMPEFERFCNERDITILDYSTKEMVFGLGLNFREDFFNSSHMNYKGAVKFSKNLANTLKALYDLPDRREEEPLNTGWSQCWNEFSAEYGYLETTIKRKTDTITDGMRNVCLYLEEECPYVSVVKTAEGAQSAEVIQDAMPMKELTVSMPIEEKGVIGVCIYEDADKTITKDAMTFVY